MSTDTTVLNRHLLLQLGDRLRALRQARGMTAVQMAELIGISRMTLRAVESGDPAPSMGTYLGVMTVLGINQELALLAGDTFAPASPGSAAARSRHSPPQVQLKVVADPAKYRLQDLQSLALHEEAVRRLREHPELEELARKTLQKWIDAQPASRSMSLWQNWLKILDAKAWTKVLGKTALAQQLRQASPLGAVVPEEARQNILQQVSELRKGLTFRSGTDEPSVDVHSADSMNAVSAVPGRRKGNRKKEDPGLAQTGD